MTSTAPTAPSPTTRKAGVLIRIGAVLAALLAVTDVATAIPYLGDPMPVEIGVAIIVIAVLTVVGAVFAFLGHTWGVWLAVVTRVLSIAPMIPVFTEPDAPAEAAAPIAIQIVLTVVAIVVLLVGLVRRRAS
jgi:hypothetical protein